METINVDDINYMQNKLTAVIMNANFHRTKKFDEIMKMTDIPVSKKFELYMMYEKDLITNIEEESNVYLKQVSIIERSLSKKKK